MELPCPEGKLHWAASVNSWTQPYFHCCIAIIIINHNSTYTNADTGKYKYMCKQADSVVQVRMVLLSSDFGSLTQGERHNSYYANHPQCAAHLVVFKISVGWDPKILTAIATVPQWQRTQLSASLFKILKFSGPSLRSMTSSTLGDFNSHNIIWGNKTINKRPDPWKSFICSNCLCLPIRNLRPTLTHPQVHFLQ